MIAALVFVALQAEKDIDAKVYEAKLSGPRFVALVNWVSIEDYDAWKALQDNFVTITVTDRGTRCDTGSWASVIKTDKNEYFLIDHKKRTVLVYPSESSEEGRAAVCATTPLWPEAFGDGTSFEEISKLPESSEHVIYAPRVRLSGDKIRFSEIWWYSSKNARYAVIKKPFAGFHNLSWSHMDLSGLFSPSWHLSFRGSEISKDTYKPVAKNEMVTMALFEYPAHYEVSVVGSAVGYASSKTAEKEFVQQYVDDFRIEAVFSSKNVFGTNWSDHFSASLDSR